MTHPSFEELSAFANSNESSSIGEHIDNCERCSTILEGLRIAHDESQKKGVPTSKFFEESQQNTKKKIEDERIKLKPGFEHIRLSLKVAATIIILMGVVFYFYANKFDADAFVSDQIADNRPMPNVERGLKTDFNWSAFIINFQDAKYQEALIILDNIEVANRNSSFDFFRGLCYLYLEDSDYEKASKSFIQVVESESRFNEQARWYLALSYYQMNDLGLCKRVLLEIKDGENHFRSEDAIKLLENL